LQSFDGFAGELEHWPDAFIHFWVRGEQLSEVLHLMQPLLLWVTPVSSSNPETQFFI
jgi:hypothetical protein